MRSLEATQEYYRLDDKVNKTPEYVEKAFINIRTSYGSLRCIALSLGRFIYTLLGLL